MTNKNFVFRILFLMGLIASGCADEKNIEANAAEIDSLRNALQEQKLLNDSLQNIIEDGHLQEERGIYFGRAFESVANPEEFIIEALKQRPELIPQNGVLGGTMEFRQIEVLTEDWVLASYDDGHVQGKSIYKYQLLPGGQLEFDLLISAPGPE